MTLSGRFLWPLVLCVLVAFVLWGFGHWRYHSGWQQASRVAELKEQQTALAMAQAQQEQEERYRDQEQRWNDRLAVAQKQAREQLESAQRHADVANDVAVRLRQQIARLSASAGQSAQNPSAAGIGPSARDPLVLLTELLSRADRRAGELAAYADRARIAGAACQQAWPERSPSD
ncbi:hypothetical protein TUM12370_09310 [Salmonella enterica subsp. enterica serovar Choleraesuis]|nr:hypothetical protein TUM12370_09310 [Salmonella enterica subsp. enterica serovar Choleraesuis]